MSDIVLSASVRQNLLSLQSTADLLATTQNRLATGNKVNSALDNPTSYFTAQNLNSRASDINNLLDSIGNGVQVLQAANTGITSLQKLVDSAKSVANQALQTDVGYAKATVTAAAVSGATADDLRGSPTNATFTGTAATASSFSAYTAGTATGTVVNNDNTSAAAAITTATLLVGTASASSDDLATAPANGDKLVVNGKTITFDDSTTTASSTDANGNVTIGIKTGSTATVGDVLSAIDTITGGAASTIAAGKVTLNTSTTSDIDFTGSSSNALAAFGLTTAGASPITRGGHTATTPLLSGTTILSGTATDNTSNVLSSAFADGDTLTVDGKTLTFKDTGAVGPNQISTTGTVADLLAKIDGLTGATTPSTVNSDGTITLSTGTAADLSITSSNSAALGALGLGTSVTQTRTAGPLSGTTLTIGKTGDDGVATTIVFGDGTNGTVKSLNDLNAKLAANNLQASINTDGVITLTTSNDSASDTIGAISGTATAAGGAFDPAATTTTGAIANASSQQARADLVTQYNTIINQITTTAQDSSFNGVNLLNGDQLKLVFNENGNSSLNITGVTFNPAGLGLTQLTQGSDFIDNDTTNKVLSSLDQASRTLSSEASTLGSNLSIVQIRQDFSKNLINVLQTGASNLTLADTNEEAANSQALSTRQSIAVSALALANQSQQSVLKLLQ